MSRILLTSLMLLSTCSYLMGQVPEEDHTEQEGYKASYHSIALSLGHGYMPTGLDLAERRIWLALPTWGLDYDYRLNEKWAIGLHTDLIMGKFEVSMPKYFGDEDVLDRTYPLTVVATTTRRVIEHFNVLIGFGAELAKEKTFMIARLGVDFGWEFNQNWELRANVMSDLKIEGYQTFIVGLGVARAIGKT